MSTSRFKFDPCPECCESPPEECANCLDLAPAKMYAMVSGVAKGATGTCDDCPDLNGNFGADFLTNLPDPHFSSCSWVYDFAGSVCGVTRLVVLLRRTTVYVGSYRHYRCQWNTIWTGYSPTTGFYRTFLSLVSDPYPHDDPIDCMNVNALCYIRDGDRSYFYDSSAGVALCADPPTVYVRSP